MINSTMIKYMLFDAVCMRFDMRTIPEKSKAQVWGEEAAFKVCRVLGFTRGMSDLV